MMILNIIKATYIVLQFEFVSSSNIVKEITSEEKQNGSKKLKFNIKGTLTTSFGCHLENNHHIKRLTGTGITRRPTRIHSLPLSSIYYVYYGCYYDNPANLAPAFPYRLHFKVYSASICANECYSLGYTVFGLQYHGQCYCGTLQGAIQYGEFIQNDGFYYSDSGCRTLCSNGIDSCGGQYKSAVYTITNNHPSKSPFYSLQPVTQIPSIQNLYYYIGCYSDSSPRALEIYLKPVQSVNECFQECYTKYNYPAFGLNNGFLCFCGNIDSAKKYGKLPNENCNIPCRSGEMCGAFYVNSVYIIDPFRLGSTTPSRKPKFSRKPTIISSKTPIISPSRIPTRRPATKVPTFRSTRKPASSRPTMQPELSVSYRPTRKPRKSA